MIPYPYPPLIHHQHFFLTPSLVWPPIATTPATVHKDTPICMEQVKGTTKELAISPSAIGGLASLGFGEQPVVVPSSVNAPSGSQKHPDSGTANHRPRLEDLPDPPPAQRPVQTIRALASAAIRSDPKGKLTLEEIVDRICSRLDYFQDLQSRNTLKVRFASPSHNNMLIEMIEKY
jgi:hypothetical protein